jgi:hypothetical protein
MTTTTTIQIDLGLLAASSVEHTAEAIEAQLALLDRLADAAGLAAQDDASFVQFRQQIRNSLLALRGDFNPITAND